MLVFQHHQGSWCDWGSAFVRWTVHTNFLYMTSTNWLLSTSLLMMKKNMFVPLIWLPTPCANCPHLLAVKKIHASWHSGFFRRWWYYNMHPILLSRTALAIWWRTESGYFHCVKTCIAGLLLWNIATYIFLLLPLWQTICSGSWMLGLWVWL